jgi:decaprenyl-phosphate phosphoribosyltransferase
MGTEVPAHGPEPRADAVGGWIRALRPRQWAKNGLLVAAPAAAGVLGDPGVAWRVSLAFVLFCLAASGTYLVNDAIDAEADRRHPVKRGRPVAAGVVPARAAAVVGLGLQIVAIAAATWLGPPPFTISIVVYVVMTFAYSLWLKRVAVIDIVLVAAGFIVRALAGGLVVGLPFTAWFLIVASFGALFVVSGKRHAEVLALGDDRANHRAVLAHYTPSFTQHLLTLSSGVTIVAYCLWAFEIQEGPGALWLTLSVLPFVTALLRYGLVVHRGEGGEPEDVLLRDRGLQGLGIVWAVLVAAGVYGG